MFTPNHTRDYFGSILLFAFLVMIQVQPVAFANARSGNEEKIAAESSNRFAIDLHRYLSKAEGNLFYFQSVFRTRWG